MRIGRLLIIVRWMPKKKQPKRTAFEPIPLSQLDREYTREELIQKVKDFKITR